MIDLEKKDVTSPSPVMHWQPADGMQVKDTHHRLQEVVRLLMLIEEKSYDIPSLRKFVKDLNVSFTHASHVEKQLRTMLREQYHWEGRNQQR